MSYQNVCAEYLKKIQDVCSLDVCHISLNIYFKSFPFPAQKSHPHNSQRAKKGREGNVSIHHRILVGEKKTGKNKQSNRKDGRPTKVTSKWQLGSRDSDEQSLKTDGLFCQRKSWSGRTAHMSLIREDDWGFFKSEQSWKWVGSKDGSLRQHSN